MSLVEHQNWGYTLFPGKISVLCYFIEIKGNMVTTSANAKVMENTTVSIINNTTASATTELMGKLHQVLH